MEDTLKFYNQNSYQIDRFKKQLNEQWIVDNLLLEKIKSRITIS